MARGCSRGAYQLAQQATSGAAAGQRAVGASTEISRLRRWIAPTVSIPPACTPCTLAPPPCGLHLLHSIAPGARYQLQATNERCPRDLGLASAALRRPRPLSATMVGVKTLRGATQGQAGPHSALTAGCRSSPALPRGPRAPCRLSNTLTRSTGP